MNAGGFEVIAYRGASVMTRDGWIADVKSRGGVVTQVPGGIFHDVPCGRFGSTAPFVYELPPAWLMLYDGLDWAVDYLNQKLGLDDAMSGAANQLQPAADAINDFTKGTLPTILWAIVIIVALAIGFALYKDLT